MKTDDQTAIIKVKRNPGLIGCFDKLYKFKELFNCKTGFYLRTGILEKDIQTNRYIDTGVDPFMRFMPSLIDIGIMGECVHGRKGLCMHSGVQCYQDGLNIKQENMSLENFREIIEQVSGKIFQCALGGRGDPNKHENFAEILRYCREKNIVPNSSSSSFIILCKEELTREKLYEIFRVSEDHPLYDLLKDIADTIFSKASRTTKEEIQQGYDEIPGKYADIPGKDYHWYHGDFEDEGVGAGSAEAFLCATDLNFENEDFIMIHEGGY
jgi:hypothetical protein